MIFIIYEVLLTILFPIRASLNIPLSPIICKRINRLQGKVLHLKVIFRGKCSWLSLGSQRNTAKEQSKTVLDLSSLHKVTDMRESELLVPLYYTVSRATAMSSQFLLVEMALLLNRGVQVTHYWPSGISHPHPFIARCDNNKSPQ